MTILALTTRLADELTFAVGSHLDGFAIRDLGLARRGLDLELALHAIANNVEVKFAHAGENSLTRVLVGLDAKGRVFGDESLQRIAHLFLVSLGVRLD